MLTHVWGIFGPVDKARTVLADINQSAGVRVWSAKTYHNASSIWNWDTTSWGGGVCSRASALRDSHPCHPPCKYNLGKTITNLFGTNVQSNTEMCEKLACNTHENLKEKCIELTSDFLPCCQHKKAYKAKVKTLTWGMHWQRVWGFSGWYGCEGCPGNSPLQISASLRPLPCETANTAERRLQDRSEEQRNYSTGKFLTPTWRKKWWPNDVLHVEPLLFGIEKWLQSLETLDGQVEKHHCH